MIERVTRWARPIVTGACVLFFAAGAAGSSQADPVDRLEEADVPPAGRAAFWLRSGSRARPPLLVYTPAAAGRARSRIVLLHGMCDVPEAECPAFAGGSTADRLLVCPRADLLCEGGGASWSGASRRRSELVETALSRVEAALPERAPERAGDTLVGFSLGGFAALDVAEKTAGRFRYLVLIGARVEPDALRLQKAGVEAVLLAAGERDMTRAHMAGLAERLRRRGVRARFSSLGNVGHAFADDMDAWFASALDWLENGGPNS
jgi:predicted esterase